MRRWGFVALRGERDSDVTMVSVWGRGDGSVAIVDRKAKRQGDSRIERIKGLHGPTLLNVIVSLFVQYAGDL